MRHRQFSVNGAMALREVLSRGGVTKLLWRVVRRWKWSIAVIMLSFLMAYVLFWVNNPLMEMFFPLDRVFSSYLILVFVLWVIILQAFFELKIEYRTYYICEGCYKNFILDGHANPDARCPFCSSKKLHVVMTAMKRDEKGIPVERKMVINININKKSIFEVMVVGFVFVLIFTVITQNMDLLPFTVIFIILVSMIAFTWWVATYMQRVFGS